MPHADYPATTVRIWFDPVCPYSWNTTRWLNAVADKTGLGIDWRLMNLAVLNEGRQLPPPQQDRMHDSRRIGRLMVAVRDRYGAAAMADAYRAFGSRYFDHAESVDDDLVTAVLSAVGADIGMQVLSDVSLDPAVRDSHQEGQDALGETGGSPIVEIGGHAFFGPVLTALPAPEATLGLFDAVAALGAVPEFSQLQRPRIRPATG